MQSEVDYSKSGNLFGSFFYLRGLSRYDKSQRAGVTPGISDDGLLFKLMMMFSLKKKIAYLLPFFLFFWLPVVPASGDDAIEKNKESEEIAKPPEDRWKLDVGGQIRLRGDFAWNQNFTDFSFTPGHSG